MPAGWHAEGMENQSPRTYALRRTAEQIKEILERFAVSGKTASVFAAEEGIKLATFGNWLRKQKRAALPKEGGFVELAQAGLPVLNAGVAQVQFSDGLTLELRAGFQVEALGQLIQLLRRA